MQCHVIIDKRHDCLWVVCWCYNELRAVHRHRCWCYEWLREGVMGVLRPYDWL